MVAETTSDVAGVVNSTGTLVVWLGELCGTPVPVGWATGIVPFVIGYLPAVTVDFGWGRPVPTLAVPILPVPVTARLSKRGLPARTDEPSARKVMAVMNGAIGEDSRCLLERGRGE